MKLKPGQIILLTAYGATYRTQYVKTEDDVNIIGNPYRVIRYGEGARRGPLNLAIGRFDNATNIRPSKSKSV